MCNLADLLTRGLTAKQLLDKDLWRKGPKWLGEGPLLHNITCSVSTDD